MDIQEKYCAIAEKQIKSMSDDDMQDVYCTCSICDGDCENCSLALDTLPE